MAFVRPTPNKEDPKPTPSSLAPFLMTAPLRCATLNLAWPAGTTCSSTTGGLLAATSVTLHPDTVLHFSSKLCVWLAANLPVFILQHAESLLLSLERTTGRFEKQRDSGANDSDAQLCKQLCSRRHASGGSSSAHLEGIVRAALEPLAEGRLIDGSSLCGEGGSRCWQPHQHGICYKCHHHIGKHKVKLLIKIVPTLVQLSQYLHGETNAKLDCQLDWKAGIPKQSFPASYSQQSSRLEGQNIC